MTDDARARFLRTLGRAPDGCDLAPRIEARDDADGIARELVSYDASPGVRVRAWLFIPAAAAAAPMHAALCIHQHNGEYHLGKSEPAGLAGNPDLAFAAELARRGFVTLAPDLDGFEDRQASPEQRARWGRLRVYGTDGPRDDAYERFIANRMLLEGSTLQARYVHDLKRALDYLATRREVDARRIGAIGHSLGGQEACWLALADRRVRCAVSSCGVSTFATILRDGVNHNCAAYAPGLLEVGDVDALVAAIAPTPLMLLTGRTDPIFPLDGVREIGRAAEAAWRAAGAPDAFRLLELEGGHGCPPPARREAYAWLERWLST